jgi:hypothetical protein
VVEMEASSFPVDEYQAVPVEVDEGVDEHAQVGPVVVL